MKLARKFLVALTLLVWALLVGDLTLQLFLEQERTDSDMRSDHLLLGRSLAGSFQRAWHLAGEREALGLLALSNEFQHQVAVRWVWLDAEGQGPFAPRLDAVALRRVASGSEHSFELGEGEKAALVTYVPAEARGRRGAIELRGELGDGSHGHVSNILGVWGAVLIEIRP